MWHDTWTFRLDDTVELLTWLHDVLPGLDPRVEPVVAATRLPDVPLHDGTARPDGTVLLLHTTVMADSDADAIALLAALQDGPLAGRELGHVQDRTTVLEENLAQAGQNPGGLPVRRRLHVDRRAGEVLAPLLHALWSELDTEHSFSIWYGWAPRGDLPDMAFSVEANAYVATYAIYADRPATPRTPNGSTAVRRPGRPWRRCLPGRHRLHPAAGPVPVGPRVPPPRRDPRGARPVWPFRGVPDV